ncbi:MAG TPA: YcaO-like family protein [Candidatus Aquilonibacter sp.]|nr:YcaO-like family protein [Candidatus Aquilonibacter sp.]
MTYLPPASRHDVLAAAQTYDAVLVIDGVFHHDLAPSPKECFAALEHARMFGAASMGALRAAECAPYGFTPLGVVANWYVREVIDGDDEVALLTHPATFAPLTVPLVNVRFIARAGHRRGLLSLDEHDRLIEAARAIFYMERTWDDVLEHVPARSRGSLETLIPTADLKRLDAQFALRSVLRRVERGDVGRIGQRESPTQRFAHSVSREHTSPIRIPDRVPKAPGTYDRAVPFDVTSALLPELRARYGVTRVANTTLLDRTMIPTYSALVPHSPDLLGVYNGKGYTSDAAVASAVMEAVERQIGAAVTLPVFKESIRTVAQRIDLDECGMRADAWGLTVDCVLGTELMSGDAIPVPLAMVQSPWFGEKLFDVTSSNGLASGNNVTEAIYHALCELIERHAWTMYHVRCAVVPRFYGGKDAADRQHAIEIDLPVGEERVDRLVTDARDAGLSVRALALDEPPLPLTILATVSEPNAAPPMAHIGLGCALSPAHALTRALTECVQSRVVDIQAAREDILRPYEPAGIMGGHARRTTGLPENRWYYDLAAPRATLDRFDDRTTDDLAQDLRRTIDALRAYGVSAVIAVDLSPPDAPVSVVRAIVPGLETFVFTGRMGSRARALLNPFAILR